MSGRGGKRVRNLVNVRNNQEDMAIEAIDINTVHSNLAYDLREALRDGMDIKDLKKLFGDKLIELNIAHFIRALENEKIDDAQKYSDWLAQYCMSKSKEGPEGLGKGADLLMEVVAKAMSASMNQKRLEEGDVTDV